MVILGLNWHANSCGLPKVPHFCYTIAMTAYDRIFDKEIKNYGLVAISMAKKNEKSPVVLDVAIAKSFKVAGIRMF